MKAEPRCPRCRAPVRPPGLWSSDWECAQHGPVLPLHPAVRPAPEVVEHVVRQGQVPLWLPWPMPAAWLLTGIAYAGDERTGARAVAVACSGPNPIGGGGEMVIVAEEPGVGLGAGYAGLAGPDPGLGFDDKPPHAKVHAGGHPTPLWWVDGQPDSAVYVGEASGLWLWTVFWPDTAGHLLAEHLELVDLRDIRGEIPLLPFGALSPRL